VAVCELAFGAAPRHRRRGAQPLRQRPELLRPGSALRRCRRARRRHLLDLPEVADEQAAELRASGLYRLRHRRLSPPGRDVLRRSAGVGGRCGPARPRLVAHQEPGLGDPRATTSTRRAAAHFARPAATSTAAGAVSTSRRRSTP
jgi:hypothetical protein